MQSLTTPEQGTVMYRKVAGDWTVLTKDRDAGILNDLFTNLNTSSKPSESFLNASTMEVLGKFGPFDGDGYGVEMKEVKLNGGMCVCVCTAFLLYINNLTTVQHYSFVYFGTL